MVDMASLVCTSSVVVICDGVYVWVDSCRMMKQQPERRRLGLKQGKELLRLVMPLLDLN